ncbi:MAG: hypothetical protein ACRDJI_03530 [Actinomycetota bacterium]
MEADLQGHQRKIVKTAVRPAKAVHGTAGIAVQDGGTLPFVVTRYWNAPAGNYPETWYLIDPATNEVLHEGPVKLVLVWGLQSLTEVTDRVAEPVALGPGTYRIVFALGGVKGGEVDVEAYELPAEAAA